MEKEWRIIAVMQGGTVVETFTGIFERENDALFRFCYSRTSDRELAVELTQESFCRLWAKMNTEEEVPNPRAFLYVVARHLIIDWYRKHKSLSLEALSESLERPLEPHDEAQEGAIESSSDASRVLATFEKLGPSYRDIMYMRFVEDLPPREIAETLGLTPNSVSVRISKGLAQLRKLLGIDLKQ